MFKNPTPKQLAFYAALTTSLAVFIAVVGINISADSMGRALNIVLLPILTFVICFFAAQYLIETFIYRRIKVIYKKISEDKKSDSQLIMSGDTLEDVENEVENWTGKKDKEIATLKEIGRASCRERV